MKFLCIIPVFNEENNIKILLDNLNIFKRQNNLNIDFLFINCNSVDNSLKLIQSYNFNVISLRKNKGVGYALLVGLKIASKNNYDVLIHIAGNSKMSPFDIERVIEPIISEDIDFVSGTRFTEKKNYENNPLFRIISIKLLSYIFSFLFKEKITDATCGFRALKIKKIYKNYKLFNKKKYYTYGYEYYSYGKILLSEHFNSCEVSVKMDYRKRGKNSKIRPIIDWFPIIIGYLEALIDKQKLLK